MEKLDNEGPCFKKKTKGQFKYDQNMQRLVKGSAEFRQNDLNNLLDRN